MNNTQKGRNDLIHWKRELRKNIYQENPDSQHSIQYYYTKRADSLSKQLYDFGGNVARKLEPLVNEKDYRLNLPRLEKYSGIGEFTDEIVHHPNYIEAGKIIYGPGMMKLADIPGKLLESLSYFFLSSHGGKLAITVPLHALLVFLEYFGIHPIFLKRKIIH